MLIGIKERLNIKIKNFVLFLKGIALCSL